jgi:hypothetical protein
MAFKNSTWKWVWVCNSLTCAVSIQKSWVNILTNHMGLSKWNEYIIVIIQEYMNSETESESKITTEFCWGYFYIIKKKKKWDLKIYLLIHFIILSFEQEWRKLLLMLSNLLLWPSKLSNKLISLHSAFHIN